MRGNIIDLAAGVIIGGAFNKIVDAVVTQLIMPVIGILTGGASTWKAWRLPCMVMLNWVGASCFSRLYTLSSLDSCYT